MKFLILPFLAMALLQTPVMATDCYDYSNLSHWIGSLEVTGSIGGMVVSDGFTFITTNDEELNFHDLKVVDTSDPEMPQIIGSVEIPSWGGELAVSANVVCVAYHHPGAGVSGLRLVDLTDPTTPHLTGGVALPSEALALAIRGNYVYAACETGLLTFDISNPSSPRNIGIAGGTVSASDIFISGDHAYVTCESGLQVLSLDNPENPEIVGDGFDLPGFRMVVSGDFIYVLCRDDFADSFLSVLDATDPENLIGVIDFFNIYDFGSDLDVMDGIVYVALKNYGMLAINPENPNLSKIVGHLPADGISILTVSGGHAFAAGKESLQITEIPLVDYPVMGGLDGTHWWSFSISGDYGYAANYYEGFKVVDIHDPEALELVTVVQFPGNLLGAQACGNYAYVQSYMGAGSYDLLIVDISSPEDPQLLSMITLPSGSVCLKGSGDFLYFTSSVYPNLNTFHVLDVSNHTSPNIVGSLELPHNSSGLAVSGHYAYAVCSHYYEDFYEIQVIDISDPELPVIVGTLKTPGRVSSMKISDNKLIVSGKNRGGSGVLSIVDILNPENPFYIGQLNTPEELGGIDIAGDIAYVTGAFGHWGELGYMKVIDFSIPESPFVFGSMYLPPYAAVEVTDEYLFIAGRTLIVVPRQCNGTLGTDEVPIGDNRTQTPKPLTPLSVHPNPFNPSTSISFACAHDQHVELRIFDMAGKCVALLANRSFEAGFHSLEWLGKNKNGQAVASGSYLLRMVTEERVTSKKMMLVR